MNTFFVQDPLFNPAVKHYIDSEIDAIEANLGDGSPKYFDTDANIQAQTEDKGLAVATDTGKLYYWDNDAEEYTYSGVIYTNLSNYYTKTESDNTFAPKSTAITHSGSQLQDYSGNNVYPTLDDGQITRNKEKFYTAKINDLLDLDYFDIEKRTNYAFSSTLGDFTTYNDGRLSYFYIKVTPNTRYWSNAIYVSCFNANKEFIEGVDGFSNVYKNFDLGANVEYVSATFTSVTTSPKFQIYKDDFKNEYYDSGLTLVKENFDVVKTKCKKIISYDRIISFDGLTAGNNVVVKNDTKRYFSNDSKLCIATKIEGGSSYTATLSLSISSWDSITLVFYIPYETWYSGSENSGYIQGYVNGNLNYGFYLNGRYKWGWNVIKLRKTDIGNGNNAPSSISSLTITLNPRGTVTTGNTFGYITLDSIIVNLKMKPTILLNFDQVWQETIDNGGYDLLFNNNIKFTLFTHGFSSLTSSQKEIIRKSIDDYNCEFSCYGGANGNNGIINTDSNTYLQKYNDIKSLLSEYYELYNDTPISYATSQSKLTPKMENAILDNGFKMIRALSGLPIGYFDENMCLIPHIEISTLTYDQIKTMIDNAITYGDCLQMFTHGIANDSDSQIQSTSITISVMTQVVNYLVTKRDAGELELLTFSEFYKECVGE